MTVIIDENSMRQKYRQMQSGRQTAAKQTGSQREDIGRDRLRGEGENKKTGERQKQRKKNKLIHFSVMARNGSDTRALWFKKSLMLRNFPTSTGLCERN